MLIFAEFKDRSFRENLKQLNNLPLLLFFWQKYISEEKFAHIISSFSLFER
jgi:hypothetical protein